MTEKPHKQILALDLGQNCGWALRRKDGQIYYGTAVFKPNQFSGGGMALLRFRQWLDTLHETSEHFDMIVFEEVRRHLGTTAGKMGMIGIGAVRVIKAMSGL